MDDTQQVQIFQSEDGNVQLSIKLEQETLWMSQVQMSHLFDISLRLDTGKTRGPE